MKKVLGWVAISGFANGQPQGRPCGARVRLITKFAQQAEPPLVARGEDDEGNDDD